MNIAVDGNWLTRMPLARRMQLLLLLPLLAMFFFAGFYLWSSSQQLGTLQTFRELELRTGDLLPLVSVLQEERGLRFAFDGPYRFRVNGVLNEREYQRGQLFASLQQAMAEDDWTAHAAPEVWAHFQEIERLYQLLDASNEAERSGPEGLAGNPYSALIVELLALRQRISRLVDDPALYSFTALNVRLLEIGEQVGRQRALGAWVLVARGGRVDYATELLQTRNSISAQHRALFSQPAFQPYRQRLEAELLPMNTSLVSAALQSLERYFARLSSLRGLPALVGYGGMIHDLKNFILRAEQRYYLRGLESAGAAQAMLDTALQDDGLAPSVRRSMQVLQAMVLAYGQRFERAAELLDAGLPPREIDQAIRYDDGPALAALEQLFSLQLPVSAEEWFSLETERVQAYYRTATIIDEDLLVALDARIASLQRDMILLAVVVALVLLVTLAMVVVLYRDFAGAIAATAHALMNFAERGALNAEAELPPPRDDEVGQVQRALHRLLENHREIIAQATAIREKRFERLLHPRSDEDELSLALLAMLSELEAFDQLKAKELQLRGDQVQLSETLRESDSVAGVADSLLHFFCDRLNACAGRLYVADVDGILGLAASYCVAGAGEDDMILQPGEGLAGQALKDRHMLTLSNVNGDGYVVRSGLGSAQSLFVIAVPMVARGQCVAVLELACEQAPGVFAQRLLEAVSESVALGLHALNSREQLADNARRLQEQATHLMEQREELRASNEELKISAASLRESEAELRAQQRELEARNQELAEKSERLRMQQQALAEASRYKSEFLANMSHELRTPLNSILVLAQTLEQNSEGNLTEDQVEVGRIIRNSGKDLLELINDILDISKVEAGQLRITMETVLVADVLASLRHLFNPLAAERGLDFLIEVDEDVPQLICTDSLRLGQILRNFLSNAMKFTHRGQVRLHVCHVQDWLAPGSDADSAPGGLCFAVEDSGIGMSEDALGRIFEAFQQADGSTTRDYGGTGLGLTISTKLAGLLGGEIGVSSEEGQGSRFFLMLPEREIPEEDQLSDTSAAGPAQASVETGSRVLVLGAVSQTLSGKCADRHFALQAVAGPEALEAECRHDLPRAILVLPPAGSAEVCALLDRLRSGDATADLPIIALLAEAPERRELDRWEAAGVVLVLEATDADERIVSELQATAGTAVQVRMNAAMVEDEEVAPIWSDRKLLMVDDDVRSAFSMSSALRKYGLRLLIAESGERCLARLQADPELEIVLMDMMMPGLSGLETIRRIRAEISTDLPVIVLSAKAMKEDREAALAAGANDYLVKPVDIAVLVDKIRQWIEPDAGG